MYAEFVSWVRKLQEQQGVQNTDRDDSSATEVGDLKEEALVYFNKKDEFEVLARARVTRKQLKSVFNAQKVADWTGPSSDWRTVKSVMQGMRGRLKGDEGVLKCWEEKGEEELQRIALVVLGELDPFDLRGKF